MGSKAKYRNRDTSRDTAEETYVPVEIKKRFNNVNLNKGLKITLYGAPFTDSRPRTMASGAVAMVNMELMKKVFIQLYERSELLQNTVIISPYIIVLHAYKKATQETARKFKRGDFGKRLHKLYTSEQVHDMSINDVDNMIKIHNDILFEPEFRICLDDAWNIADTDCFKVLSDNERVELYIYYTDQINAYMEWNIMRRAKYYCYLICDKNRKINNRTLEDHVKYMKKIFDKYQSNYKSESDILSLIKRTQKVIQEWSADEVKQMAGMSVDRVFNKRDAQNKVLLLITKGNKIATDLVNKHIITEIEGESNDVTEHNGLYTFY